MRKILVTGATGYLGRHLVPALKKNKFNVMCLVRRHSDVIGLKDAKLEIGDIIDIDSLNAIIKDNKIDVVIHLAAITNALDPNIEKVNVIGTKNLVGACKNNKVKKIIFISSSAVFNQLDRYGLSKKQGELILTNSKLKSCVCLQLLRLQEIQHHVMENLPR